MIGPKGASGSNKIHAFSPSLLVNGDGGGTYIPTFTLEVPTCSFFMSCYDFYGLAHLILRQKLICFCRNRLV